MTQPFFGGDRTLLSEFTDMAGANAEGVVCAPPGIRTTRTPSLNAFRKAFQARFGEEPDTYAAHPYDGMNMLIWAIQAAGFNRAKIRDVLAYRRKPWPGVTGDIAQGACARCTGGDLAKRERPMAVLFPRGAGISTIERRSDRSRPQYHCIVYRCIDLNGITVTRRAG